MSEHCGVRHCAWQSKDNYGWYGLVRVGKELLGQLKRGYKYIKGNPKIKEILNLSSSIILLSSSNVLPNLV